MGLILHEIPPSPPVRAVKLCLAELGLQAEYKLVDLLNKAQLSEDFVKKNPQHTVPTLEDGDVIIWDSHVINAYLVSTYAKDESLYPKDPKTRAFIDQKLHFDSGILFPALRNIGKKIFYRNEEVSDEDLDRVKEALSLTETFLDGRKFITGDSFNIADFSVYTTTTCLLVILPEQEMYPNISKYLQLCKSSFKGAAADEESFQSFKGLYAAKLQNKA